MIQTANLNNLNVFKSFETYTHFQHLDLKAYLPWAHEIKESYKA